MYRLVNPIRRYAWGSHAAIAELTGRPAPTAEPEAELWMGAHPTAPSRLAMPVGERSLLAEIEADPVAHLGKFVASSFGGRLPFLFKVLAAEQPLSLQAHPSSAQAKAGFAAEEERGIARDADERNYPDAVAKPELFVALERCEVLCGFRPLPQMVEVLQPLDVAPLAPTIEALRARPDGEGLREVVTYLLTQPEADRRDLVDAVGKATDRLAGHPDIEPHAAAYAWVAGLARDHPGDAGVVIALLLNHLTLKPDEGVYLPPGCLHAYLRGLGIEILANSDNVLRGGLTRKHVDVPELLRVLDCTAGVPRILRPEASEAEAEEVWPTTVREFSLARMRVDTGTGGAPVPVAGAGPQILLVLDGAVTLASDGFEPLCLARGESAYLAAGRAPVTVTGAGTVLRAGTGLTRVE